MIETLSIDDLVLMDVDSPPANYYVNKFNGLELPPPRTNRLPRSRRHGAIELTTYYDPREFEFDVWVFGNVVNRTYDWDSFWTAFEALKDKLSLSSLTRTLTFTRKGDPYLYAETAEVVMANDINPRWPHPGTPVCVFECAAVASDPRLYGPADGAYSVTGQTGTFNVENTGNFPSPPLIIFNGASNPILTNTSLTTENSISLTGASGNVEVDCRARTVKVGSTSHPEYVDASLTHFWSLRKGINALSLSGGASSVDVYWYDARV